MEPKRKNCSIYGTEYDSGSFSDFVHQFIEASTDEELNKLKKELLTEPRLAELNYWSEGVLSEFVPHFEKRLKNIDVHSNIFRLEIDKWNSMGFILGQLQAFKWSEQIYRALYTLLCDLQETKGRIHKGTPLHQIGWVNLLRSTADSIKKSQYYIKLAMIEDILTDDSKFMDSPAYKVLKGEHALSEAHLNRLANWIKHYIRAYPKDPCLRPELIYLDYLTNRKNQERSNLYDLDPKLAKQLFQNIDQAKTSNEKGRSLEILLAYLFLTSPCFEVLRNLTSFDSEIDLLIRNLHKDDPLLNELGKYILVECRNIKEKVDAKAVRDFAAKIIHTSCNSGILITKQGISGDREKEAARDARMAILKVHQRHSIVIIPLAIDQFIPVVEKQTPLLDILISEYEKIRFDLP